MSFVRAAIDPTRLCLLLLLEACTPADGAPMEPAEPRQLVDVEAWTEVADGEDPFVTGGAPERIWCDPEYGFGPEPFGGSLAFEVYTGLCNWATVEQPLLDDVAAGELVRPRLWHFELAAPDPAEGYTAVAVEGDTKWEYRTPIPAPGKLVAHGWIAEEDIPAGTMVQFHVDNHGFNSWSLLEITAETPSDDED